MKFKAQNPKSKIIFMGTPEFGAIVLEGLIKGGYKPYSGRWPNGPFRPILVVTASDKPVGRKQILTPPPVKLLAEKYNIDLIQPAEIRNSKFEIRKLEPDLIVVAAYSQILPEEILEIPKYGCLNVHPSLLPRWRGPAPIQYAILDGDKETGVTIILMDEKMDHGKIISNSKFLISNKKITYPELLKELSNLGANLLLETVPKWIKGKIKPEPQDESKATYTKIIKKEDGRIDWKKPAEEIERQIRAFNPWPGTYTIQKGKILKILKAEISNGKLIIKEVQPEGKKPMNFEDFLRGYPDFVKDKEICSRILI